MIPHVVVAMALAAAGAQASVDQSTAAVDDRWQPWLGCWVADEDARGARTCVTPGPEGGVSIVTLVGVQQITRETRIADDRDHAISDGDCRGTERMHWSARGPRVFRTATVTCGAEPTRTLSGLTYIASGPIWVDVQAVQRGDETNVRVRRYHPAASQRLADGGQADHPGDFELPSQPWNVDDVLEMTAQLPPDAVEAVLGETRSAFALNSRALIRLSDAGVSERVIDLMVALTYPEKFVVQSGGGSGAAFAPFGAYDPFFAPILGPASLYGCYDSYGWAHPDYWRYCGGMSPYFLSYGPGFYNGYYGYGNGWIVTSPPVDGGGGSPGEVPSAGRVVNGRGYTQITPVDTSAGSGDGGRSNGFATGSTSNGSNSSSGSSGVSSGGYSGGGASGGDGGRMAMPRPPGH